MRGSRGFEHRQALPRGHVLNGRYELVEVLGVGGFGVTYLGRDSELGRRVAIKEYFPNEVAVREGTALFPKSSADGDDVAWGLARFLDEARTLARFRHPNLVRVMDYFKGNGTAYIVMEYEDGEPLGAVLRRLGTLSQEQLRRVLLPIVGGLGEVHAAGFLHRDIKPENVFIRRSDESPVLLDFGAARQALGRRSRSLTAIASAGYSPPEQYESGGEQGVWTDIYALSALCYRAITGEAPVEAPRRLNRLARGQRDPLPRLAESAPAGFSRGFLDSVDRGLDVDERKRPASLGDWASALTAGKSEAAPAETGERLTAVAGVEDGGERGSDSDAGAGRKWLGGSVAAAAAAMAVLVVAGWLVRDREPAADRDVDGVSEEGSIEDSTAEGNAPNDAVSRAPAPAAEPPLEETNRAARLPVVYGTLTLALSPPDSSVSFAGSDLEYRAGMRLPEGSYRLAVSGGEAPRLP